jgi:hypothetical protein
MKRKTIVQVLKVTGLICFALGVALAVHIYMVTRKPKADATTISLARIDFQQQLSKEDSVRITSWLYQQKGVEHVLCNLESNITVFSFRPIANNADEIAKTLAMNLNYKAQRYKPSAEALQSGCPVGY